MSISGFCPYCHKEVTYSWVYFNENGGDIRNWFREYFKNNLAGWAIGECPSCKKCVLMEFDLDNYQKISSLRKIYPYQLPSPVDARIPELIKKDLEEAKLCFSVGAFNAASVMSRRSIQRACKEKGATKKDLIDQIDELAANKIITEDLKELAHAIRLAGNDGAHPNEISVDEQESKEILELAEQFMEVVFVAPAKVREIREKRRNQNGG